MHASYNICVSYIYMYAINFTCHFTGDIALILHIKEIRTIDCPQEMRVHNYIIIFHVAFCEGMLVWDGDMWRQYFQINSILYHSMTIFSL